MKTASLVMPGGPLQAPPSSPHFFLKKLSMLFCLPPAAFLSLSSSLLRLLAGGCDCQNTRRPADVRYIHRIVKKSGPNGDWWWAERIFV
jgi:hypothetical protein